MSESKFLHLVVQDSAKNKEGKVATNGVISAAANWSTAKMTATQHHDNLSAW